MVNCKVADLKITELVLVHSNIVNINYQQESRVLYTFIPSKSIGLFLVFHAESLYFQKPSGIESLSFPKILMYWSMIYWSKFLTTRERG